MFLQEVIQQWLLSTMLRLRIVYYLLLTLIRVFHQFNRFDKKSQTKLVIEAGAIGWSHIDYQEQYLSACEYLGEDNVVKSIIDKKCNYVDQVSTVFQDHDPSHYYVSVFSRCWQVHPYLE